MDRQLGALSQALEQWEGAALRARDGLEGALATATASEEEYDRLTARLEDELKELDGRLRGWSQELIKAEGRSNGEEAVEGWQQAKVQQHEIEINGNIMSELFTLHQLTIVYLKTINNKTDSIQLGFGLANSDVTVASVLHCTMLILEEVISIV